MPNVLNFRKGPSALLLCVMLSTSANAIILYGADNSANLTDPGTGLPFDTVARVASAAGVENGGSGVHIGGGYMLTAAHIGNTELASVTFDGNTFYTRDVSYIPTQVGSSDMKIFKLSTTPTVGAAALYTGSSELLNGGYLVGWGRGRVEGSPLSNNTVPIAGGGTSLVKRWGTNDPTRVISGFSYTQSATYTYDALETVLGNTAGNPADNGTGAFEAAAAPRDSGSGYFQEIGGIWYLTGITSVILQQSSGEVTYGNDLPWVGTTPGNYVAAPGTGDPDIFVRISSYASDITMAIPEPSSLFLSLFSSVLLLLRRRH